MGVRRDVAVGVPVVIGEMRITGADDRDPTTERSRRVSD
jgi:hypothetical protein